MKKALDYTGVFLVCLLGLFIILKPEICIKKTLLGILLCGNVIIPSVFPFTFCVIFINQSGILRYLKPINKITNLILGLNFYEFSLFLLSLVGGYPLGAKLLSQSKNEKAPNMINFCINAGPAFVILAVGKGAFKSVAVGWILFSSHVISSLIIALILNQRNKITKPPVIKRLGVITNFVSSASTAAETVIKICSLVILFSVIGGYIENLTLFSSISLIFEVTNAVFKCKNIITVSFLLGFAGISIWCQVLSLLQKVKINYVKFVFFRILHGILSASFTFLILKIFKISTRTLSNNENLSFAPFINGPVVSFSLLIMGIVLIISLYNKKYAGNLIEDIV